MRGEEDNIRYNTIQTKAICISHSSIPLILSSNPSHGQLNLNHKLPLLIYFHGGAFCVSSPFTANYHNYINAVVSQAKVVAVSINYSLHRLALEHPIPAAYEDSWASHKHNSGPQPWLNEHADFDRVFLCGDSAGANIVHNLAMVAWDPGLKLGMDHSWALL